MKNHTIVVSRWSMVILVTGQFFRAMYGDTPPKYGLVCYGTPMLGCYGIPIDPGLPGCATSWPIGDRHLTGRSPSPGGFVKLEGGMVKFATASWAMQRVTVGNHGDFHSLFGVPRQMDGTY